MNGFPIPIFLLMFFLFVLGTSRLIRSDHGTENLNIAAIQVFFRQNENSFRFGKSTTNQVRGLLIKITSYLFCNKMTRYRSRESKHSGPSYSAKTQSGG